jgi:flagellar hook-associated protein 3 FlgL
MSLRVTERSVSMRALAGLQSDLAAMAKTQQELSSGSRISKPSDDPAGTVEALLTRSTIAQTRQHQRSAQDGLGWLGTADSALSTITGDLQRIRTLLVQSQNGTTGPTSQQALAQEVDQLRQEVLSQANATYAGHPVFAGSAGTTQAYSAGGVYQGDSGTVLRQVGPSDRVAIALPGTQVFGPAGADLHAVLSQAVSDLSANPAGVAADITALDAAMTRVQDAQTQVGALYDRVQTASSTAASSLITQKTQLSDVQDADLAETMTTMQMQQVAYQAALTATARAVQPSLLDFLK